MRTICDNLMVKYKPPTTLTPYPLTPPGARGYEARAPQKRGGAQRTRVMPQPYGGTSLVRKRTPLGPYRRPMPRVQGGSRRVGIFLWARYPCTLNPILQHTLNPAPNPTLHSTLHPTVKSTLNLTQHPTPNPNPAPQGTPSPLLPSATPPPASLLSRTGLGFRG